MSAALAPPASGTVYSPAFRVKAGGVQIGNAIEALVTQTNTWDAAKWSASVALQDADAMNAAWWASQSDVRIEIDIAMDGVTFQSLLSGKTDEIDIDWASNVLTITGRDLTALLIDQKTATSYQNQTSSQIAAILAAQVGLGTSHIVATTTPVGEYYADDTVRMSAGDLSRGITMWDLLVYLAQQEGFDLFVQGGDLYFQPTVTSAAAPFQVIVGKTGGNPHGNVTRLGLKRRLALANGITVTVESVNSYLGKTIKESAGSGKSSVDGPASYVFYKPNLTPAQTQAYANQKLAGITRFEREIDFDCPGEMNLTPRGVVRLSGTGTAFDQLYYPDEISRHIHFKLGFTQTVTARNVSAVDQVALATGSQTASSGLDYSSGGAQ